MLNNNTNFKTYSESNVKSNHESNYSSNFSINDNLNMESWTVVSNKKNKKYKKYKSYRNKNNNYTKKYNRKSNIDSKRKNINNYLNNIKIIEGNIEDTFDEIKYNINKINLNISYTTKNLKYISNKKKKSNKKKYIHKKRIVESPLFANPKKIININFKITKKNILNVSNVQKNNKNNLLLNMNEDMNEDMNKYMDEEINLSNQYVFKNYRHNIKVLIFYHFIEIMKSYNILLSKKTLINDILNTIIYCYETDSIICDGVNLAMTTIDRDKYNNIIQEDVKINMKRNWKHVYDFTNKYNTILVLKTIIHKKPRISERNINFSNFNNKALWINEGYKCIDDLIVIIIANILSLLYGDTSYYYTNDKFTDHVEFINIIQNKFNTCIKAINLLYEHDNGFTII